MNKHLLLNGVANKEEGEVLSTDIDGFTREDLAKLHKGPPHPEIEPMPGRRLDLKSKPPPPRFCIYCGEMKGSRLRVLGREAVCDLCFPEHGHSTWPMRKKLPNLFCKDCGGKIPTDLKRGGRCTTCADAIKGK